MTAIQRIQAKVSCTHGHAYTAAMWGQLCVLLDANKKSALSQLKDSSS